jgi:hypothetical protein
MAKRKYPMDVSRDAVHAWIKTRIEGMRLRERLTISQAAGRLGREIGEDAKHDPQAREIQNIMLADIVGYIVEDAVADGRQPGGGDNDV